MCLEHHFYLLNLLRSNNCQKQNQKAKSIALQVFFYSSVPFVSHKLAVEEKKLISIHIVFLSILNLTQVELVYWEKHFETAQDDKGSNLKKIG